MLSPPPLQEPRRLTVPGGELWVVDEALPHLPYGGNKVRKLVGVLGEAHERGATDLLTFGAVGSHHVYATALYGAAAGLRVHAVFVGQPHTPHVEDQARRSAAVLTSYGVCRHVAELPVVTARRVASIARSSGRPPLQVPPGGSSVAGTLGWVEAGQRLAAWLPGDTPVVVAAGSGGTAAGLWAGGCRVVAVRVSPRAIVNRQRLRRLGRRAGARAGVSAPDRHALQIDARWLAGGYGHVDPTTRRAAELGRSLGLPLETTYTAKAFAAALELLATRRGPVCFVQTASAPPTQPPPPDLPAELRMLCEHAPAAG